jgi:hypothetical protein
MSFLSKYKNIFGNILFVLFIAVILALSVRGLPGNPTPAQLNTLAWKDNGPFELSPERGRFALLYALVENHTFHLSPDLARFTAPDVGFQDNNYVSIFAPSISIIAIPGYIIGKYFDVSQFGTFAWMAIFALLNALLIQTIAKRLGANSLMAALAALTFLFATPAFAYAVTIYEHHVSTFLILLSFYLLLRFNTVWSLFLIWILYGIAFTVDYPNLFMMFPIAFAAFLKSGAIDKVHKKITLHISLPRLLSVIGVVIPLACFLWINQMSYNDPFTISGSVSRVMGVRSDNTPILMSDVYKAELLKEHQNTNLPPPGSIFTFFEPRNMLNGLYILLISPDRGVILYTPVVLFGIVGIYFAFKKRQNYIPVAIGVIGFDLLLYAMWGDPYGGWAFGGRYLIPAYAILCIYLALLLTKFGTKKLFLLFFYIVFSYSVMVNSLGALTSNNNPPKVEADALSNITHTNVQYTYLRNMNDLNENISKSYVYQAFANNYLSAWEYYSYMTIFILVVSVFIIMYFDIQNKNSYRKEE